MWELKGSLLIGPEPAPDDSPRKPDLSQHLPSWVEINAAFSRRPANQCVQFTKILQFKVGTPTKISFRDQHDKAEYGARAQAHATHWPQPADPRFLSIDIRFVHSPHY